MTDTLQRLPQWQALLAHRDRIAPLHLRSLFAEDPKRFERFSLTACDLLADFSKQRIDAHAIGLLLELAQARQLSEGMRRMAAGERINYTEGRAALHIALRAATPCCVDGAEVTGSVRATLDRVLRLAEQIRAGTLAGANGRPIRHVINLGIGGSDLGPRMATRALARFADPRIAVDYVANVDPAELAAVLARADPAETLFILSSKSFTTVETLTNARTARAWLCARLGSERAIASHFVAVTNNLAAAARFGIPASACFELPEWVGGRYSMWSAIGLPLACAIGSAGFRALLEGARAMDEHFLATPPERNLPVWMALVGIWNIDFLGAATLAVLPYSHALGELPAYLQQLEMESNGKRVGRDGNAVAVDTAPIVWGGAGTVGQHAFHQLFYQGTHITPIDFVVPAGQAGEAQDALVGSALAQSAALMLGRTGEEARAELAARKLPPEEVARLAPHLVCPGNQPSTTLLFPSLTPAALGSLVALYEHKVFVQGWIWGINSFDQYGVELGKQMARSIALAEAGGARPDASTEGLTQALRRMRGRG
ncbi:MAG: glucose-6-phosphate isomerase [Rhodocyclaceae bacterium]